LVDWSKFFRSTQFWDASLGADKERTVEIMASPSETESEESALLASFLATAQAWDHLALSSPKRANKLSDKLWDIGLKLERTDLGRRGLEELTNNPSPAVRLKAATRCLRWAPEFASSVLEEIEQRRGPEYMAYPSLAKIVLTEYRAGRLDLS
jgi:hypothetical protein